MKNVSRKMLAVVLCLAMVAGYVGMIPSPVITASAETTTHTNPNLLANSNPSFESVNDIEGWSVSDTAAVFQSNTVAKDGKLSLKIKDTSSKDANFARSVKVSVVPGEVYYVTAEA